MVSDIDVAQYIFKKLNWVDSWVIQKLTYYAQAWSLAWTGEPLFNDRIQAWDDGPVAPNLYRVNKYGTGVMGTDLPGADITKLGDRRACIVDAVLLHYGGHNKESLVTLTHNERPWKDAYAVGRNSEISQPAMNSFYASLALIGGSVPSRPKLDEPELDEDTFTRESGSQIRSWQRTLSLLAR